MDTRFIGGETVAESTMRFVFEKPEGFAYAAGQSIDLTLVSPRETDGLGNMRPFTLSSSPDDEHLAITTRMRDTAFKRTLGAMTPGTAMKVDGPFGELTLPENADRDVVFLAGGIGITPFYAMSRHAATHALPHRIALFYTNRTPEGAAFLTELAELSNPNFSFIPTMTSMDAAWSGERGRIDAALLARHLPEPTNPLYYIAGPMSMVSALRGVLNGNGVKDADIRTEEFTGY